MTFVLVFRHKLYTTVRVRDQPIRIVAQQAVQVDFGDILRPVAHTAMYVVLYGEYRFSKHEVSKRQSTCCSCVKLTSKEIVR